MKTSTSGSLGYSCYKVYHRADSNLSGAEVIDIIHWFQSLWPDRIYATWININAAAE